LVISLTALVGPLISHSWVLARAIAGWFVSLTMVGLGRLVSGRAGMARLAG
jgi:hypothetical protein